MPPTARQNRKIARAIKAAVVLLTLYLAVAYLIIPRMDRREALHHPSPAGSGHLTRTATGLPGDPVNLMFAGSEAAVVRAFLAAGWSPANALGFSSSVRIAVDTVFNKPDPDAPVSNLYLFGRKEDLAFEKPVGHSPRERHHIRLWRSDEPQAGRPLWLGAATHDTSVEFSRTTGQVTHHIDPDVDAERDLLLAELTAAGRVQETSWITGDPMALQGRNGGGDPWHTDGRLPVIELMEDSGISAPDR